MRTRCLQADWIVILKNIILDLILTPHLYAAEVLTCLKHRGLLSVPVIAIGTDYTCIPFWEETDCDCYIVPQKDLLGELIHKGLPKKAAFSTWYSGKAGFFPPRRNVLLPESSADCLRMLMSIWS